MPKVKGRMLGRKIWILFNQFRMGMVDVFSQRFFLMYSCAIQSMCRVVEMGQKCNGMKGKTLGNGLFLAQRNRSSVFSWA